MKDVFGGDNENAKIEKSLDLAREFLSGSWNLLKKEDIQVQKILGGLSNILYLVSTKSEIVKENEPRKFLVRINCQPLTHFQITQDNVVFSSLAERGLGPKTYGLFEGGRLEEFLESRTFNEDDVRVEENAHKIGETFRKFHSLQLPISKKPQAILKMRQWLEEFRQLGGESHEIVSQLNYSNTPKVVTIADLQHELKVFEEMCTVFDDTVVFSHNDLAPANILELNSNKELVFIDFEYALYNWRGFDIGMHLSEFAFDYRTNIAPFFMLDPSMYEHHPRLRTVCSAYMNSSNCDDLMEECRFFWPLCNMFFAIWSLRNYTAKIDNGTDLSAATSDRLAFYFHLKDRSIEIYEKKRL